MFPRIFSIIFFRSRNLFHCIRIDISCRFLPRIRQTIKSKPQNQIVHVPHMPLQRHPPFPLKSKPISLQNPSQKMGLAPKFPILAFIPKTLPRPVIFKIKLPRVLRRCFAFVFLANVANDIYTLAVEIK